VSRLRPVYEPDEDRLAAGECRRKSVAVDASGALEPAGDSRLILATRRAQTLGELLDCWRERAAELPVGNPVAGRCVDDVQRAEHAGTGTAGSRAERPIVLQTLTGALIGMKGTSLLAAGQLCARSCAPLLFGSVFAL
jgi:hypothetical protein